MAASNVIFNLSRSPLPQSPASRSLSPSLKISRVCFISTHKFSKGGNVAEKNHWAYDGKVWCTKAKPTTEEDVEDDKSSLLDKITGAATEYAEETMENVKGATGGISETAKVYADDAKVKTTEAAETIAGKAEDGTAKVEEPETTESDSEKVKETPEKV